MIRGLRKVALFVWREARCTLGYHQYGKTWYADHHTGRRFKVCRHCWATKHKDTEGLRT